MSKVLSSFSGFTLSCPALEAERGEVRKLLGLDPQANESAWSTLTWSKSGRFPRLRRS